MNGKSLKETLQQLNGLTENVTVLQAVVTSSNPLAVQLINDEKMTLSSRLLVVPEHLRDYSTIISIDSSEKQVIIMNSLREGDVVYILGYNSGKKYVVLGRV